MVICSAYSKAYIEKHTTVNYNLKYLAKPLILESLNQTLSNQSNQDAETNTDLQSTDNKEEILSTTKSLPTQELQTILLAEDNKINQIVATKLLQSLGLKVDIAEDGVEAIEKVEQGQYSVVLMDIQMPKMDGKEATIALRKKYSHHQLKIIALTANITEEEVSYYKNIGMDGHLGKPYELTKIKEVLSNFFQLSQPI